MRARAAGEEPVILVGTPRSWFFEALAATLEDSEFRLLHAGDVDSVLRVLRDAIPDLVLLHDELAGGPLPDLCDRLRTEGLPSDIPLVAVAASTFDHSDLEIAALEAGAWIVLREPIDPVLLAARLRRVLEVSRRLREADAAEEALDESRGVYSRRGLMKVLSSIEALARRQGAPLSCAVLGPTHPGRGETLERQRNTTAEMCRIHVRRSDVCGWLGPGELVVVAYDTPVDGARELVLRLNAVASEQAEAAASESPVLSAGIAELFPAGEEETVTSPGSAARGERVENGILVAAREALERARQTGGGIERAAVA